MVTHAHAMSQAPALPLSRVDIVDGLLDHKLVDLCDVRLGYELCLLMGARCGALYVSLFSCDLQPITLGTYWTEEKCAHLHDVLLSYG